jgi:phospholipase C
MAMATPKYVFTLMLENRSFDHMLGRSGIRGIDANAGTPTVVDGQASDAGGDAKFCLPVGPAHNFTDVQEQVGGDGFAANYAKEIAKHGGQGADPQDALRCFDSARQLPVLHKLASEFVVCDAWFSSMPGPTWPNRFFVHAASSGGLDHSPGALAMATSYRLRSFNFENGHIFKRLQDKGIYWSVLAGSWLPQCFAMEGMHEFWGDGHKRDMKDIDAVLDELVTHDRGYVFIEPSYGDFLNDTYKGGTSQHALDDVTRGEWLLKAVYERLRNHRVWDDCALIVTWDEHGGFWDHVTPPAATPPGDRTTNDNGFGFRFDRYGVRVPALLISPLTQGNQIDHRTHDHSTVLSTLNALWPDLGGPFTARDAEELHNSATLATLFTGGPPRTDCPTTLPDPVASDCPPDDDAPFTSVADVLGVAAVTLHAAQSPDAPPSDNLAGFAHIAHLMEANAALPVATAIAAAPSADEYVQSVQSSTGSVQEYLDRAAERLRPGETIRHQ